MNMKSWMQQKEVNLQKMRVYCALEEVIGNEERGLQ